MGNLLRGSLTVRRIARTTAASVLFVLMVAAVVCAAPTVTFTVPTDGSASVSPGAQLQATFSEAMDPSSINAQTFTLTRSVKIKAISAGTDFNVVLKSDGTVAVWGEDGTSYASNDSYGSMNPPPGLKDVIAISAGDQHIAALKKDGTVVTWGGTVGPVPAGLAGVTAISAGSGFTMALKNDGTVVTWGATQPWLPPIPAPPAGLSNVVAIAAGSNSGVALKKDGTLVGIGSNTPPSGVYSAVAAGNKRFLALTCDGTVVAWGSTSYVPTGLKGVVAIAAAVGHNGDHAVALKEDGTVVAWGSNVSGQLNVPTGLSNVKAIAAGGAGQVAGGGHTVAIKADGTVVAWGANDYNQATVPTASTKVLTATEGTLAVKRDGTVVAWGGSMYGTPTPPPGLTGIVAVSNSQGYSLALKDDGTVVDWGSTGPYSNKPAGLCGVKAIAVGYAAVALKEDGTVVTWGPGTTGTDLSRKVPAGLSNVTAVATLAGHILALKADGTVVAWGGYNNYHELDVPAGLKDVVAIAAGTYHSVALKKDGTIVAWGDNSLGATSVPAGLTGVTDIAAGGYETMALTSDGRITQWGRAFIGISLKRPASLDSVAKLSAGGTVAVKTNGGMLNWGTSSGTQTPLDYRNGSIYESLVSGTISYDPNMTTATFIPSAPLEPGLYTAEVAIARSAAGAKMVSPATWTFTTADYDPSANPSFDSGAYQVCFRDTEPPVVTAPPNITVEATSPLTMVNIGMATATDNVGVILIWNDAPKSYPVETTPVHWYAKDAAGLVGTATQYVTVQDKTPPVLHGLANQTLEATSSAGAVASFEVTATDLVDPAPRVSCIPASGSTFPLGETKVECVAEDAHNNRSLGSFTIKVQDTTAPQLKVPQNITVLLNTPLSAKAVQDFLSAATAVDVVDGSVPVTYTTPSLDSVGAKVVTFTAVDHAGNKAVGSATITVVYGCGDFLEPVSLLKPFKQGSTIPVKLHLCDASGADVLTAVARLSMQPATGSSIDASSTSAADSGNLFRIAGGKYMYNLNTKPLPSGEYQIRALLDDGTTKSIPLQLKP